MVTVSVPSAVSSQTFTVLVNGVAQTTLTGSQVYGPIALEGQELLTVTGATVYAGQSVLVAGEVRFVGVGEANPPPNVYNVLDYGADPTGVNDSSTALSNAFAACQAAGGGIVYADGTFLINSPVASAKAGAYIHLMGAGEGRTKFVTGSGIASADYTIAILSDGGVSDATFDSNGLAPCPLLVGNETRHGPACSGYGPGTERSEVGLGCLER